MAKRTKKQIDNRANEIRRDDDKVPNLSLGLYDLDYAIKYYIDNVIKPKVKEDKDLIDVPVMYASPERWVSIQRDGYLRTEKGQLMIPLITYRKNDIGINPNMYRFGEPNNPHLYIEKAQQYSKYNRYDNFEARNTIQKPTEYHNIVVPTYIDNSYDCMMWSNTSQQMNKLIEAFIYARDSYWGSNNQFKFRIKLRNFSPIIETTDGADRFIQCNFSIDMNGYIIHENIQKELSQFKARDFSKTVTIDYYENIPSENRVIPERNKYN